MKITSKWEFIELRNLINNLRPLMDVINLSSRRGRRQNENKVLKGLEKVKEQRWREENSGLITLISHSCLSWIWKLNLKKIRKWKKINKERQRKYASSDITEEEFQTGSRWDLKPRLASSVEGKSFRLQREKVCWQPILSKKQEFSVGRWKGFYRSKPKC